MSNKTNFKSFLDGFKFSLDINDVLADKGLKDCSHPIISDGICVSCLKEIKKTTNN